MSNFHTHDVLSDGQFQFYLSNRMRLPYNTTIDLRHTLHACTSCPLPGCNPGLDGKSRKQRYSEVYTALDDDLTHLANCQDMRDRRTRRHNNANEAFCRGISKLHMRVKHEPEIDDTVAATKQGREVQADRADSVLHFETNELHDDLLRFG